MYFSLFYLLLAQFCHSTSPEIRQQQSLLLPSSLPILSYLPLRLPTTTQPWPVAGVEPSINDSEDLFSVGFSWGEWGGVCGRGGIVFPGFRVR